MGGPRRRWAGLPTPLTACLGLLLHTAPAPAATSDAEATPTFRERSTTDPSGTMLIPVDTPLADFARADPSRPDTTGADSQALPALPGPDSLSAAFRKGAASRRGPGPFRAILEGLIFAYREGISPVDGPSCPYEPTCSGFARHAVKAHGPLLGVFMAGDRLMRCNGSSHLRYPRVGPEGRYHDPVP